MESHQGLNAVGASPYLLDEQSRMEAQGATLPQYHQHQQYGPPQHAFSSQLDMAQQPAPGRPGAFNMNGMANALPQGSMRHGQYLPAGQQQHQQQQRFSPAASSPSMMPQMPQMAPQYPGQAAMPMGNPHYYMPQHHQMQHYYASQLSPTQQQARPNMGFYPNQMVMNHPQNSHIPQGYYYPSGPYPHQGQAMPNHMVAAQYLSTTNTAHADPRIVPPINGVDQSNVNVSPNHKLGVQSTPKDSQLRLGAHICIEEGEGRSGIVRGPPRKPRQSGKSSHCPPPGKAESH